MMYRNFAIAILLAAPIIVMGVQSFTPKVHHDEQAANVAPPPPPPPPVVVAPPPSQPAASFAPPVSEAGQPSLVPGSGLPDTPVAPMVNPTPLTSPGMAPPGSPNAEP